MSSKLWIRYTTGFLASACVLQNDTAQAQSLLAAALDPDTPPETLAQRLGWYARAELALSRGEPDPALRIADQLIESAPGAGSARDIPRLSHLRGEALAALRRTAEAETAFRDALEVAAAQGARPLLWRTHVSLGKLLGFHKRHEEAEREFAAARKIVEELAAGVPEESVRDGFLRHVTAAMPRRLSPRQAAKAEFGGLTRREREVAVLVAGGKTNREISDALFVGERTIETHVSHILSKLGFDSRRQITEWAAEKGLEQTAE